MRIGLLTTSFPRVEGDVPGHFVLGFARALAARGHTLEVLAPEPHEPRFTAPPAFPGIDVRWVRYAPRVLERTFYGDGVLDNLRTDKRALLGLAPFVLALAQATRRAAPEWDAVVSHWALPCALVAGELVRGRPQLAVLHSADVFVLERLPAPALRRVLAARIATRADALLFSSRDLRRRFLALLDPLARAAAATRAHVCPMGIDPAPPSAAPRAALRARLGLTRPTVLSLGRLIALKGVQHAVDAVAQLPDTELVVAGYGPEQARLEAQARRTGARVRFVGPLHGAEKEAWLTAADAFVLPSIRLPDGRTEGMPNAVLEAMEHGLPVVASDVGGVCDVVRSGDNGLLVPPGEPVALRDALRTLEDRTLRARLARGARETAGLYHWSAIAPRLEELLCARDDDPPAAF